MLLPDYLSADAPCNSSILRHEIEYGTQTYAFLHQTLRPSQVVLHLEELVMVDTFEIAQVYRIRYKSSMSDYARSSQILLAVVSPALSFDSIFANLPIVWEVFPSWPSAGS